MATVGMPHDGAVHSIDSATTFAAGRNKFYAVRR